MSEFEPQIVAFFCNWCTFTAADLAAYLRHCRDHHAAMITQHMRFTAGAVLPVGDFLAQVGDWTGLPPSELLGLMRGTAEVSAGGSDEMTRLNRGRAYYAQADKLGEFLFADYIRNKRRMLH